MKKGEILGFTHATDQNVDSLVTKYRIREGCLGILCKVRKGVKYCYFYCEKHEE